MTTWIITERGSLINLDHIATVRSLASGLVVADGLVNDMIMVITTLPTSKAEGDKVIEYIALALTTCHVPLDFWPGKATHMQMTTAFAKWRNEAETQPDVEPAYAALTFNG